jgi:Cdc6-like AAA superfamily ATPase
MGKYKINSLSDNGVFIVTESYRKLYNKFKSLRKTRGRIIHVIGAPGTGKSANIYAALDKLDLNIFDVEFRISDIDMDAADVFEEVYNYLKREIKAKSKDEIYEGLSRFDALLFADRFHDSHLIDNGTVGFSVWMDHVGFKATKFYLLCINEYLRNRNAFHDINIILQTAWRVYIGGKKYDVFSDLGILSRLLVALMGIFFEVVEISYSPQETLEIVKEHVDADEKLIESCIDKYGYKPRFICQALDKDD